MHGHIHCNINNILNCFVFALALFILPCYLSYESAKAVSIVRLFYLPLLQILFRGSAESEVHHRCQKLAKNIFINIQKTIEGYKGNGEGVSDLFSVVLLINNAEIQANTIVYLTVVNTIDFKGL